MRGGRGGLSSYFLFRPMGPTLGDRAIRIWGVVFFLALGAVGLLTIWAFPRQDRLWEAQRARLVETEGVMQTAELDEIRLRRPRRATRWEVESSYVYVVDGQERVGFHADFSSRSPRFSSREEAVLYARGIAPGTRVRVWYDAANPLESARSPTQAPVSHLVWPLGGLGALSVLLALRLARHARLQFREVPLSDEERRKGLRMAGAFASAVAAVSLAIIAADVAPWLLHAPRSLRLRTAKVYLTGDVEVEHNPTVPEVAYFFRAEPGSDRFTKGNAWRFGRVVVHSEGEAEAAVRRILEDSVADRLVVHFDPKNPARNALYREFGWLLEARTAMALAALLGVSAFGALRLRRAARSR